MDIRDKAFAGRAYFLAAVMTVACELSANAVLSAGFGRISVYRLYILGMALFMILPSAQLFRVSTREISSFENPGVKICLTAFILAIITSFISSHVSGLVYSGFDLIGFVPAKGYIPDLSNINEFVVFVFYAVIMAAVSEEIVMRGIVLSSLASGGTWRAVFASAALFSLLHGRPESLLQTFIAGIVLGFIYAATDSVVPCVVFHMAYNACVVGMSFIPSEWSDALFGGGCLHNAVSLVILSFISAGLMLAIRKSGAGEFSRGKTTHTDSATIILYCAGIATMICVFGLNTLRGFTQ